MGQGTKLIIAVVLMILLAGLSYKLLFAKPDAPIATAQANDLSSCANGTVECPNTYCLKREKEGWRPMRVAGHPDTDIWMTFVDAQGRKSAYNQHHIGHVIEPVNGTYTDTGVCPVCKGTTRVCK